MAQLDRIPYGFKVGVEEPIDTRLVLKKVEMEAISNNYLTAGIPMPPRYIALCSDDNKMYEYDSSRTQPWGASDIGKFSPIETVVDAYAKYYDINGKLVTEQIIHDKVITVDLTAYERKDNLYVNPTTGKKVAETGQYSDLDPLSLPVIGKGNVTFSPVDNMGTTKVRDALFNADGSPKLVLKFNANAVGDVPWNLPTAIRTSNLVNDGNDGSSPFETKQEVVDQLVPYSLIEDTGYKIEFIEDSKSPREYSFHAELYNKNGVLLSKSKVIDLPMETAVNNVELDSTNKKIIVERINGTKSFIDLSLAVVAFDLADKAYVNSEGAKIKALVKAEETRAKAREDELEADKEQRIVPVAPITKVVDTDPKKIDIGLDINSRSLEVDASGKLSVNLTASAALERVAVSSSADTFNVLVDDSTVKINTDNKLEVPIDKDTIYIDPIDGKIKGSAQMGAIHSEYATATGHVLGAAEIIDNPDPSVFGTYKKLIGVHVDNATIKVDPMGRLVASAAKLTDVKVNGKTVVDNDPTSPTYTQALVKITGGTNTWINWNSSEGVVIEGQEFILGDGLAWAPGSSSTSKKPMLKATGVVGYYSSLLGKPYLSLNGKSVEIDGTIELDGSVASGGLGLVADTMYKPTSNWFTSGIAVKSAIDQFKNSLDSKAQAQTGYALSYVKMEDGTISKVNEILIPTVHDGVLTVKENGVVLNTFSADEASNKTVDITVPTLTSDLTNDGDGSIVGDKYALVSETGNKIDVAYNVSNYSIEANLLNKNGVQISTDSAVLPISSMFLRARYVESLTPEVKKLVFTDLSGAENEVDLKPLVDEYEKFANKVTSAGVISAASTDTEYPSAKLVYNSLLTKEDKLPTYIDDEYLHVNPTTHALEWSIVESFKLVDNTSTLITITEAFNAGKIVVGLVGNDMYLLKQLDPTYAIFESITGMGIDNITATRYVVNNSGWIKVSEKKAMNHVDYVGNLPTDAEKVLSIQPNAGSTAWAPAWVYPALKTSVISLPNAGWSATTGGYTKSVALVGVREDRNPIVSVSISKTEGGTADALKSEWSKIYCVETATNTLTFYATDIPALNLLVQVAGY